MSDLETFNDSKKRDIKTFILNHSKKQSICRKIKNKYLSLKYKLEDLLSK